MDYCPLKLKNIIITATLLKLISLRSEVYSIGRTLSLVSFFTFLQVVVRVTHEAGHTAVLRRSVRVQLAHGFQAEELSIYVAHNVHIDLFEVQTHAPNLEILEKLPFLLLLLL